MPAAGWQRRAAEKSNGASVFPPMPRYFFYIRWGQATILDRQGVELANIEEALEEAVRRGRDMTAPDLRKGNTPRGGVIIIDDELGTVRELSFKEICKTP